MSDSAFASHLVSQTRANVEFLQTQGYLTVEDAASIRAKLADATLKTSERLTSTPASAHEVHKPVPTSQVHPPRPPEPPQPTPSYPRAKALWAYNEDRREPNDLTMSAGDVIDVVEETNGDWWTGRNKGKQGLFPSNYVQKLPSEPSSQPYQEKLNGAPASSDYNHPPPQQMDPVDDTLQPAEGQDKKKKKFGKYGNTVAHSAAGGLGFGAGAAVGSGIIHALF